VDGKEAQLVFIDHAFTDMSVSHHHLSYIGIFHKTNIQSEGVKKLRLMKIAVELLEEDKHNKLSKKTD